MGSRTAPLMGRVAAAEAQGAMAAAAAQAAMALMAETRHRYAVNELEIGK